MNEADRSLREIESLRSRLSRLSRASLRITEDLDPGAVLQEIADEARSLTGASYALIATLDRSGDEDFTTSGLNPLEVRRLWETPGGPRFFEYLSAMPDPLRVADFAGHARSVGLPEFLPPMPVSSLLAAPVRHRGAGVGYIYVAKSGPGEEFSAEDEETLVMFATQSALVISNSRRLRDERRARADLETLIDTSPVGVVVFDARTGTPASFNREARRLADGLLGPGQSPEDLLGTLTVRRGDGQQTALAEMPLARAMSAGGTVRAEEMAFISPDGRSVSVLVNATPIPRTGEVETYVVTLQDLAELEELGRMRAEFLAMASHELRAPLTSIKGSVATLRGLGPSLDPVEALQFHRIIEEQADHMQGLITDLLDVARIEAGELSVFFQPTEVAVLVDSARKVFLSGGGGHDVRVDLQPGLPRVAADRRRIAQVLDNLLSNAARHSPESYGIRVTAVQSDVHVEVCVADDGVGISAERLPSLFRKSSMLKGDDGGGFAESGMGLAICKGIVEAHGGRIWAESDGPALGARFTFTLPAVEASGTLPSAETAQPSSRRGSGRNRVHVLAVDDDPQTLRHVRSALSEAGYEPIVTGDPEEVGRLMEETRPHLVILDLMLPGADGIKLMESVPGLSNVPVIFLSAYGGDRNVARALEAGADDYIVKPFSPTELVARVEAVLRRWTAAGSAEPAEPYTVGELTVNYAERRVSLAGRPVQLTDIEYRMLFELSVNSGRVLAHAELLRRVWGPAHSGRTGAVRSVIKNLRRKLGDDAENPAYIFNEPRVGYRMPKEEGLE